MKKLVLILVFLFGVFFNTQAKNDKVMKMSPDFCWQFADAVEAADCGYVGCDTDFWFYAYDNCMATE